MSHVVGDVDQVLDGMEAPPGYSLQITGEQKDLEEARSRMMQTLAAAGLSARSQETACRRFYPE